MKPSWRHLPNADKESMIVYKGSDVIFDHETPKWNFWATEPVQKNYSYAKTCAFVQENGNATGMYSLNICLFL